MTAIASPSTTITREIPPNQVSTMAAYPNPSYAMSPGAEAIRAAVGRLGQRRPLYSSPDQIQGGNPLLAAAQAGAAENAGAPGAGTDVYGGLGAMFGGGGQVNDPQAGIPGDVQTMGPDEQTAAGGVMDAAPDFTQPGSWAAFFNRRGLQPGNPPRTPPVVAGSRVGSSMVPNAAAAPAPRAPGARYGSTMVPAYQPRPVSA